jgi:hypothetical protein
MTNLTLTKIADICNEQLEANVFEVIDDRLMNTTNRFEGNDIDITIEGDEYVLTTTGGGKIYYGHSNGYVVAKDLIDSYTYMTA